MKLSTVLALTFVLVPATASAQSLRQGATTFCNAVRNANDQGVSAAPGTEFAAYVARESGHGITAYREIWAVAKSMNIPACRAMW
jgi:hypothetical protein